MDERRDVYVGREMFSEVTDRARARALFKHSVIRVEMETHSYCNRRCSYCPNVVGDRLGANVLMADDIWERIIGGLEEIDYDSLLVLNYYNEPLADRDILRRIREARRRIPKSRIQIYSNGDYLEPGFVDELADAGLDHLHISIHLKRGDAYSDRYVVHRAREISERMDVPATVTGFKAMEYLTAAAPHPTMEIEIRAINFYKHGTDRGGLIADIATASKRTAPCYFPFGHFVVGFNGLIAPCCHIRSDRPERRDYVYGNVRDFETIFQAFTSRTAAAWRQQLSSDAEKRSPCDTCSAGAVADPQVAGAFVAAHRRHVPAVESGALGQD